MLVQIVTENGQKTIVPLTADTGTGAPVGSLIAMYKKSSPSGYLYCDGSTFDETKYPALYQYLGSNVLPDYREFALVGAEENTTDVYNASTNPTGTIHDHDVYTEGQAKDDQLQQHGHWSNPDTGNLTTALGQNGNGGYTTGTNVAGARAGTVTRGKRKAVYFYIKATSGLTENQQENVLNTINENLSYSTTEHKTGKKWIDGKDIYSKTIDCGALPNATGKAVAHNIANIGNIVKISGTASRVGATLPLPYVVGLDGQGTNYSVNIYVTPTDVNITSYANMTAYTSTYIILEYTKTNG